jgi:hypothetical protein
MTLLPGPDGVFRERRARVVAAPPEVLWSCVADLGGEPGWYAANGLWAVRGLLDRLVGGPGMRGRPDRPLRVGDPVDAWRVQGIDEGRALTLRSEHRMPGRALLTHEVSGRAEDPDRSLLVQRLEWHPDGLRGRLLWWSELPAHVLVMSAMVRNLGREAERRAAPARAGR